MLLRWPIPTHDTTYDDLRAMQALTSELSVHELPFLVGTSLSSYVAVLKAPADQPT